MSVHSRMARKTGVTLSKSVTLILISIYVVQSIANVYLLLDRTRIHKEIVEREVRISDLERENSELRERLKIFQKTSSINWLRRKFLILPARRSFPA